MTALTHRCIVVPSTLSTFIRAGEANDTYNAFAGSVISDPVMIDGVLDQRKGVHGHIHISFVTAQVRQVITCIGVWCAGFGEEHDMWIYGVQGI